MRTDLVNSRPMDPLMKSHLILFLEPLKSVDEEMFDFIVANLDSSSPKALPVDWVGGARIPKWLNSTHHLVATSEDSKTVSHYSEHWLLMHEDGSVTFPDLKPTAGSHICAETKRIVEVYNAQPVAMPRTVKRAMKISLGTNTAHTSGTSWLLYSKRR